MPLIKLRGWQLHNLCRELAAMEKTQTELADDYGITQARVSQINSQYKAKIDKMKADIANELLGLTITAKAARLAEYEDDVLSINQSIDWEGNEGGIDVALLRQKHVALKSAAEELGQLPARVNVQVTNTKVAYIVDGVNDQELV